LYVECGDLAGAALARSFLGYPLRAQGRVEEARTQAEAALRLAECVGHPRATRGANFVLMHVTAEEGRQEQALQHAEAYRVVNRAAGQIVPDIDDSPLEQNRLGFISYLCGDLDAAAGHCEQALDLLGAEGSLPDQLQLDTVGRVRLARGEIDAAERAFRDGLEAAVDGESRMALLWHLEGISAVLRRRGEMVRAATLRAAAAVMRRQSGSGLERPERPRHEAELAALRAALGEEAFQVAWAEGEALSVDQAVALAREPVEGLR
jgi:ATP/maltotriose-dependent transcriptional regulator MalT